MKRSPTELMTIKVKRVALVVWVLAAVTVVAALALIGWGISVYVFSVLVPISL